MYGRRVFGFLARIALVPEAYLHGLAGYLLYLAAPFPDLRALLLIGRGDDDAQQLAQRVDGNMGLAALAFFSPVIARPVSAFGRALQRAPVEYNGRWLGWACGQAVRVATRLNHAR